MTKKQKERKAKTAQQIGDIVMVEVKTLTKDPQNFRKHGQRNLEAIKASLVRFGQQKPLVIDGDGKVITGNGTLEAAMVLGWDKIAVLRTMLVGKEAVAFAIADNRTAELATWDDAALQSELQALQNADADLFLATGFDDNDLLQTKMLQNSVTLASKFIAPPFSILDTRTAWWLNRKKSWLALGIESEVGRSGNLLGFSKSMLAIQSGAEYGAGNAYNDQMGDWAAAGTSIFDPVLCELAYRWFCPANGSIFDPFAGGSVRGVVAGKLGMRYTGIELRSEQVTANESQAQKIFGDEPNKPKWIVGDSGNVKKLGASKQEYDYIFSCPPYGDLEKYCDDPKDLSNMNLADFNEAMAKIIKSSLGLLKDNRFACFVVGDYREKNVGKSNGKYVGFIGSIVRAFEAAGAEFYNEAILVNGLGGICLRAGRIFAGSRKISKHHQNVLVFIKGNAKKAVADLGVCDFGDIEDGVVDPRESGDVISLGDLSGEVL